VVHALVDLLSTVSKVGVVGIIVIGIGIVAIGGGAI